MLLWIINIIIIIIFILIRIAFFTLLERKYLALTQSRVGPNKTSFLGVLQPIIDGIKLLFKENIRTSNSMFLLILFAPRLLFLFIILIWLVIPRSQFFINIKINIFIFLILLGLTVYSTLISGVISTSKFGIIGGIRASAQTISYEISLALLILSPCYIIRSPSISNNTWITILCFPILSIWWIRCIAECNRAPFDFAEGERELIRGFNLEYTRAPFVFIFLGEYGIILNLSFISRLLFFNKSIFIAIMLFSSIILLRSSYPRFRYDILIILCWIILLPLAIVFILIIILIK